MEFIDLCAGIGGFRLGLELAGHTCVGFSEIDKYAVKSYRAMHDTDGEWYAEDITKLKSEEIPYADLWSFGFPCFEKGSLVMTSRGYKEIQEIKAGDKVLTHQNRFKPVVKPMKQFADEIFELSIYGAAKFKATEEHPFYVRKMTRVWNQTTRSHEREFAKAEWLAVKDLEKGSHIGIPINAEEKLPKWAASPINTMKQLRN